MVNVLVFNNEEKAFFLKKLSKKVVKILYLIEEEEKTKRSPLKFIQSQLAELSNVNSLFGFELTEVIVKINGTLNYASEPFATVRKQVLEAKGIIDSLYKKYSE